jgi:AcrR family transcriptional regulator
MPSRATAAAILPEGTARPADIPDDIFTAALATFLECRRLDMRALAGELGISRATLYRRVGGRDHLLGQVMWYLTRLAITNALERTSSLRGRDRIVGVIGAYMRDIGGRPALERLLDAEPEAALRILTSKAGPIQQGIANALRHVIDEEAAAGQLDLGIDSETLAYVIVRVGESFLYADVIADNDPDVERAIDVIERLLR